MFSLPKLPYEYNALEPYIDAKTMEIHHAKHHQAYIDKLNKALEKNPDLQNKTVEELLTSLDQIPEEIRAAVRNNAGGHWNHSFFWDILGPAKLPPRPVQGQATPPQQGGKINTPAPLLMEEGVGGGDLMQAIIKSFGSFENFKKKFSEAALSVFGSGWCWLVVTPLDKGEEEGVLEIITTPNQDSPISQNLRPLLALDLWEHAYYLKYQYRRAEYIEAWWQVVNWDFAEELYKRKK